MDTQTPDEWQRSQASLLSEIPLALHLSQLDRGSVLAVGKNFHEHVSE